MRATTDLTLEPAAERDGARWARVLTAGRPLGSEVPGVLLEAQFEDAGARLLFTTQDVPFEEQLDILLLAAADGTLLDRATLAAPYATGRFRDAAAEPPDGVAFSFFEGDRWRVRVLARAAFCWPWATPAGVSRPLALRHRLEVERVT